VGVANFLAKRRHIVAGTEPFGKALEYWVAHELFAYNHYHQIYADFSFWRLSSGFEVDFNVNDMELAIEVTGTKKVNQNHTKGLPELMKDHPNVGRRIIISLNDQKRALSSGIEVMPWRNFLEDLWSGQLF
jgi:predicted AAA+ superfamily ATPase